MTREIIFAENGSIDKTNLSKLFDIHKFGGADIVWYEKGAAKPELVSFGNNVDNAEEIKKEAKKEAKKETLQRLYDFLHNNTEVHVDDTYDIRTLSSGTIKTIYRGSIDDFMFGFENFINLMDKKIKGDDNWKRLKNHSLETIN